MIFTDSALIPESLHLGHGAARLRGARLVSAGAQVEDHARLTWLFARQGARGRRRP
jgi:hypothetical protein